VKDSKNENTQTPDFRDVADFPGVDSPDVVRDLSHESQCIVLNPHPDLEYRFVRCIEGRSRVSIAKERGWRDNPPGISKSGQMEAVRVRGYTPDVCVMAMSKDLFERRMGDKRAKATERSERTVKGMTKAPESVHGVHATGGDLRITVES